MDFKAYYRSLDRSEREAYAVRAGTTVGYLENHLVYARKMPRRDLIERLANATEGAVSLDEIIEHFFKRSA